MSTPHRLSEKDKVALTATCSVCGPGAKIRKNSKYGYACVAGRASANKRYAASHPQRLQTKSKRSSPHRLSLRNGQPDTCAICGPVQPLPWGRGWCCPKRAAELNRKVFPTAPAPRCDTCRTYYLTSDGKCPSCDSRETYDLGYAFKVMEHEYKSRGRNPSFMEYLDETDAGDLTFSIVEGEWVLPEGEQSVTPSLKVIGAPSGYVPMIRPEYAALYGSGNKRDRV